MCLVGGQHEADHLVVRQVGIERFDDPIAPVPQVPGAVAVLVAQAPRVAVAPHIHPVSGPAFPVARVVEQAVHGAPVTLFGPIVQGLPHLSLGGWQPDEVQVQASNLEASWGFGSRGQPGRFKSLRQEGIDRVPHPVGLLHRRHGRSLARAEGPVVARIWFGEFAHGSACALGDPTGQECNLLGTERLPLVFGRHALFQIRAGHARDQGRFAGFPGHHDGPVFSPTQHGSEGVQSKASLLLERAMTGEATFPQQVLQSTFIHPGCRQARAQPEPHEGQYPPEEAPNAMCYELGEHASARVRLSGPPP